MVERLRRLIRRLLRRSPVSREPVVLGAELARARAADRTRREARPDSVSPLGDLYDPWRGELDLLRFVKSDTDGTVAAMVRSYRESPPEDLTALRDRLGMDDCYTLLAFARRCAVRALRAGDPDIAACGLAAVAMVEAERVDRRDVTPPVVLLHHALSRAGGDPAVVFGAVAPLAAEGVTDLIARFPTWPENDRRLAGWGYREVATADGPGLIYWDSAPWDPMTDLIGAALGIAGAIDADDYRVQAITAASDPPAVWFSASADDFEALLAETKAGVRVSADMQHGTAEDTADQQFTVFLIETGGEADSRQMAEWAEGPIGVERAVLAVTIGPLVAVAIARSTLQDVPAHETEASLVRFEKPFRAALERGAATGPDGHPLTD